MNALPVSQLEQIAGQVKRSAHFARLAQLAAEGVQHPDAQKAARASGLAADAIDAVVTSLVALGVTAPVTGTPVVLPPVPLHLLDTPVARRYLAVLDELAEVGAELDRERGDVDSQGETVGVSERWRALAALVRVETFGPQGLE